MRFPFLLLLLTLLLSNCSPSVDYADGTELATAWADMANRITKGTPANSPTYASRCFGYLGLTMYESVVHGSEAHRSVADQLSMLPALPPPDPGTEYHWPSAFNAGQARILKHLYNQTSDENKAGIDSLAAEVDAFFRRTIKEEVAARSARYGELIADQIFEWSKSDGGHRAYLRNFDKNLVHPVFPGQWKPPLYAQSFSHHPLHPHWGTNRPFLPANYGIEAPDYIPYDTVPGSPYYEQFMTVYERDARLTQEDKEVAIWWGDDPDETFTPPGHSFYITTMVLRDKRPGLVDCAETYARVGMAVADAFINCWKWKYQFFSERPNTYITEHIDPAWESFWPDPPFPAFPSGHAIQAAAAATVLIDRFGEGFTFVDRSHLGRPRDEVRDVDFRERSFTSFWDVALETADSRLLGGIHTPQDNEAGLEKGKLIGENVNSLKWKK